MSTSPVTYKALGIPMERRAARRRLIVVTYAALAVVSGVTFVLSETVPWAFTWAIYAAIGVGIFVFGGQGRYGLIKPFGNKPPRPDAPMVDVVKLQLSPLSVGTPDESAWRNDERELAQRDRAHYTAYQPLTMGYMALLLLVAWALHPPHWANGHVLLRLALLVTLLGSILSVTLPSALILWNEPDIDLN